MPFIFNICIYVYVSHPWRLQEKSPLNPLGEVKSGPRRRLRRTLGRRRLCQGDVIGNSFCFEWGLHHDCMQKRDFSPSNFGIEPSSSHLVIRNRERTD